MSALPMDRTAMANFPMRVLMCQGLHRLPPSKI